MRTKEEVRASAQYYANDRQAPVTLFAFTDQPDRFDFIETYRYDRDYKRASNGTRYHKVATLQPQYRTMEDIKKRNQRLGNCWFDPDSMRWWSSRVHSIIYPGRDGVAYFVSSERPPSGRRAYAVRRADPDGSVSTVGEVCQYRTGKQAHAAAERFAEHGEEI